MDNLLNILPITAIALVIVLTMYLITVVSYLIYKAIEWAIKLVVGDD